MVNSSSWLAISCATSPKTRGFGKSYRKILNGENWRRLEVIEDLQRGRGKNLFLLFLSNIEPFDSRDRAVARSEQVWVVAAHHHVVRANHVSHHHQRVRAKRNRVVIQLLQIETRQLIDLRAALREVATA